MNIGRPEAAKTVFGDAIEAIERYVDILARRGIEWGLIGPRERERLWERHVLNSVALAPLVPRDSRVVDVGSGAGLPGIPLALARPDLEVVLLEPLLRRANFLDLAVEELGLAPRVRVVRGRAEELRERFDVVTARAVAPLPRLVGWCRGLIGPGGRLVALKGRTAKEELARSAGELRFLGFAGEVAELAVPGGRESTWAVVVRAR